ncbi:MAG: hypothetical protein ACI8ZM_000314 [Crocinitomix sp.]
MSNDTGIFSGLNTQLLMRLVIVIEFSCALFGAITYYQYSGWFFIYLPILLVVHLMTILALPSVFKKLKGKPKDEFLHSSAEMEVDENLNEIDLWDRASVGFYVFTNIFILILILSRLY